MTHRTCDRCNYSDHARGPGWCPTCGSFLRVERDDDDTGVDPVDVMMDDPGDTP
jgi:hypothetical protein